MSLFLACRICLACDVRMFSIVNSPLREIYEKLTNVPLQTEDFRPETVCYVCYYHLKKCNKLMLKSIKSNQLMVQLLSAGLELTEKSLIMIKKQSCHESWNLNISPMETITSLGSDLKPDIPAKFEQIKIEKDEIINGLENEEDNDNFSPLDTHDTSDSEDDIPLQKISTQKKINTMKKRRAKVKKRDAIMTSKPKQKRIVPDAKEVILSKEEQLQHLVERSRTLNYINSPYKCEMCFKGFIETKAYENHKEKHDERSGQFECEICHMRYLTIRLMRTHVVTSHSRQYLCNKCGHCSHTANQARDHERWHSGYTYECQLCGQKFRKPTSYLTHMRKRHPTEHICNICGESFVSRHGITMHKRKTHKREDETFNTDSSSKYCAECNIHFVSIEAWSKHVLSSVKHSLGTDTRCTCLICEIELPSKFLQGHLQEHEDVLPSAKAPKRPKLTITKVSCDLCGVEFVNRTKLQAHVKRIHLGKKYDKNIVCEVCGKKCTSNAALKYHQRTHSGERPYACALCPKRFVDGNQRRIHARTHSGERPYACLACGKRFTQKPALNRHFRVHTGAKPYDCKFCSKTFSQSNSLKTHVNTVHLKLPSKKKLQSINLTDTKLLVTQDNNTQN